MNTMNRKEKFHLPWETGSSQGQASFGPTYDFLKTKDFLKLMAHLHVTPRIGN